MPRPSQTVQDQQIPTPETSTVVWGMDVERGDFIKVPRALLRLGAHSSLMGKEIQPRHMLFLLNLASRKFRESPLIVEWKNIARDLGISADTARHWAYELRDIKLISIRGRFLNVGDQSRRTKGVEIDMSAFVELISGAAQMRRAERQKQFMERISSKLDPEEPKIPFLKRKTAERADTRSTASSVIQPD